MALNSLEFFGAMMTPQMLFVHDMHPPLSGEISLLFFFLVFFAFFEAELFLANSVGFSLVNWHFIKDSWVNQGFLSSNP